MRVEALIAMMFFYGLVALVTALTLFVDGGWFPWMKTYDRLESEGRAILITLSALLWPLWLAAGAALFFVSVHRGIRQLLALRQPPIPVAKAQKRRKV